MSAKDSSASASASALLAPAAASMAATSASKPASGANLAARAAVLFVRGTSSAPDLKCRVGASLFACKEACLVLRVACSAVPAHGIRSGCTEIHVVEMVNFHALSVTLRPCNPWCLPTIKHRVQGGGPRSTAFMKFHMTQPEPKAVLTMLCHLSWICSWPCLCPK